MTYHDHAKSWFLAQLKPNCAHIADRNLSSRGFKPSYRWRRARKTARAVLSRSLRPVFPGYVFVSFDRVGGLLAQDPFHIWHHAAG